MKTLNNSILINNNLKSGKVDSTLKTIELLAKLGLLPKKKKKTNKVIGYDENGEPIRQNNKMVGSVSYGPPDDKGPGGPPNLRKSGAPALGYTGTSAPAITYIDRTKPQTIDQMNKQQEQLKQQAEKLQDGGTPEEIQQFNLKLAQFNDALQSQKNALQEQLNQGKKYIDERLFNMSLGGMPLDNIQSQKFRQEEPTYTVQTNNDEEGPIKYEFSQSAEPFPKANEETTYMETDEQDFTNQGSQDIPKDVLNVDVSPSPNEIIEDEQPEAFPIKTEEQVKPDEEPKASAQAFEEPQAQIIPEIPTDEELAKVNFYNNEIPEFTQDIFKQFGFAYPEVYIKGKKTKIDKLRTIADNFSRTFNVELQVDGEPIDIKTANFPTLEAVLKDEIIKLGFTFRDQYKPKYNQDLDAWRFTQKKAKKSKK